MATQKRKRLTVRVDAGALALIRDVADRLGVPVGAYIVTRAVADAEKQSAMAALGARMDALETALTTALEERDEHLAEALDALAERIGDGPGTPSSGVTVADLQRLSHAIESIVKHETGAVQRSLFAAITKTKNPAAASTPAPQKKA